MPKGYPRTEEQRQHWKEYTANYRRQNPERVRQWRRNYVLRAADKLRDQARQQEGGEQA